MAILLIEHAREDVDLLKVVKMLLIHDVIEIDAGDTSIYDVAGNADKAEREQLAADRLQPLLLNFYTDGAAWQRHGINKAQVIARTKHIRDGSPVLWEYAEELINTAGSKGILAS